MRRIIACILMAITVATATFTVGALPQANAQSSENVEFHFLDVNSIDKSVGGTGSNPVGSADCILILDNGVTTLVDAGEGYVNSSNKVVKYLKDQGVQKIDHLFMTHPHSDHYGGIPAVVKAFDIGTAYYAPIADWFKVRTDEIDGGTKGYYDRAIIALQEKINSDGTGVKFEAPDAEGKVYQVTENSSFTVYNCLACAYNDHREMQFNDYSMIMKYTYKQVNALLNADINVHYEYVMLGKVKANGEKCESTDPDAIAPMGEIDILKLPHHGNNTLTTHTLLKVANPNKLNRFAVVTGGVASQNFPVQQRMAQYNYKVTITGYAGKNGTNDVVISTDGTLAGTDFVGSVYTSW